MGVCLRIATGLCLTLVMAFPVLAAQSKYTSFDLEENCVFHSEYEAGASAYCKGYRGYPVHFSEGDLRQMVRFGHLATLDGQWESFGQFNRAGTTIEWRLEAGRPFATILRWYISGEAAQATSPAEGQVLVISTVASHDKPRSCVVGYVDARANREANALAREVADTLARSFECGADEPLFHGARGATSGEPNRYFE